MKKVLKDKMALALAEEDLDVDTSEDLKALI